MEIKRKYFGLKSNGKASGGSPSIKTKTSLPEDTLVDNTDYTIAVGDDVTIPSIPSNNKQGIIIRLNNTAEGAVERTLSFVSSVEWIGDKVSALGAGKAYMVAILDGVVSVNEITNE